MARTLKIDISQNYKIAHKVSFLRPGHIYSKAVFALCSAICYVYNILQNVLFIVNS